MDEDVTGLVERYLAGEDREEVFRQIFAWCYPRLSRFYSQRGFSVEESSDLAQEALLRVAFSLDTFRGDSSFGSWLFGIAANIYRNEMRSRHTGKRHSSRDDMPWPPVDPASPISISTEPGPLEEVLSSERNARLQEAVKCMPSQMQQCFKLRYESGLKYHEIAVVMKISLGAVKAHLYQARHVLRQKLDVSWNDQE